MTTRKKPTPEFFLKIFCIRKNGGLQGPYQNKHWTHGRRWTPRETSPMACRRGWHVFRKANLQKWLGLLTHSSYGGALYLVEARGERDYHQYSRDKIAFETIRLKKLLWKGKISGSTTRGRVRFSWRPNPAYSLTMRKIKNIVAVSASL